MQTKMVSSKSHPCSSNLDKDEQESVNLSKVELRSYEMMGFWLRVSIMWIDRLGHVIEMLCRRNVKELQMAWRWNAKQVLAKDLWLLHRIVVSFFTAWIKLLQHLCTLGKFRESKQLLYNTVLDSQLIENNLLLNSNLTFHSFLLT